MAVYIFSFFINQDKGKVLKGNFVRIIFLCCSVKNLIKKKDIYVKGYEEGSLNFWAAI